MKLSALATAVAISVVLFGLLTATPAIGKMAIEAGLIEAPSNYGVYKDKI